MDPDRLANLKTARVSLGKQGWITFPEGRRAPSYGGFWTASRCSRQPSQHGDNTDVNAGCRRRSPNSLLWLVGRRQRRQGNRSASEGCPSSAWRNWPRCTGRIWAGLNPLAGTFPSKTCFGWRGRWASRLQTCLRPSASAPSGPVYDKRVYLPERIRSSPRHRR